MTCLDDPRIDLSLRCATIVLLHNEISMKITSLSLHLYGENSVRQFELTPQTEISKDIEA